MKLFFRIILILAGIWLLCFPEDRAEAAPFCVELRGATAECFYYDVGQCRRRAAEQSGRCAVNLKEIKLPLGYGQYCLVGPDWLTGCLYPDSAACDAEARGNKGICVLNPARRGPPESFYLDVDSYY